MFIQRTGLLILALPYLFVSLASARVSSSYASTASIANPITIVSQTYTIHFPSSINFRLSANDSRGLITRATILISSHLPRYVQEEHAVLLQRSSSAVALSWNESTTGSNFFPPGSQLTCTWQLADNSGNSTEVSQTLVTRDTRFNWQHLAQGLLQVDWYGRSEDFGQVILSQASASIAHISQNLGGGLLQPIQLWIYQNDNDFHGSLGPGDYEWVGGIAFPTLDETSIVVDSTADDTLIRDMPHELTHLIFHQYVAAGVRVPTWFDEGLAVYNQSYQEPQMSLRLKQALDTHTLLRLKDISVTFPADSDQAYLAYAESWNLVEYMYNTSGIRKMVSLLRDINRDANFSSALAQSFGEDQDHLENQWRLSLHQPVFLIPTQAKTAQRPVQQTNSPAQLPHLTEANQPMLLTIGTLLVLLPLAGIITFFAWQRRQRLHPSEK